MNYRGWTVEPTGNPTPARNWDWGGYKDDGEPATFLGSTPESVMRDIDEEFSEQVWEFYAQVILDGLPIDITAVFNK